MAKTKAKSDTQKRLDALQKNFLALNTEIQELQRSAKAQTSKHARSEPDQDQEQLIKKPSGSAGKSPPKGYNLQDAMGLAGKRRSYNVYKKISQQFATKYLELGKTISAQDQTKVFSVVAKIRSEHPFFNQFANGWPIQALLGQYLKNYAAAQRSQTGKKNGLKSDSGDDSDEDEDDDKEDDDKEDDEEEDDDDKEDDGEEDDDGEVEKGGEDDLNNDLNGEEDDVRPHKRAKLEPTVKTIAGKTVARKTIAGKTIPEKTVAGKTIPEKTVARKTIAGKTVAGKTVAGKTVAGKTVAGKTVTGKTIAGKTVAGKTVAGKTVTGKTVAGKTVTGKTTSKKIVAVKKASKKKVAKRSQQGTAIKSSQMQHKEGAIYDMDGENEVEMDLYPSKTTKAIKPAFAFDRKKDLPSVCPAPDCFAAVTTNPSPILIDMFEHLERLRYDEAAELKIFRQELTICGQVRTESTRGQHFAIAKRRGWLVNIDFARLPERILSMKDELDGLLTVAEAKEQYYCWEFLVDELKNMDISLKVLANMSVAKTPLHIIQMFRPGYYGEMGAFVIQSILLRLYDPAETPTDAFAPLNLAQYTKYFLVPHIASRLIQEDQGLPYEAAWEEMQASMDIGASLQQMDDNNAVLDDILKMNCKEIQKARQLRETSMVKNPKSANPSTNQSTNPSANPSAGPSANPSAKQLAGPSADTSAGLSANPSANQSAGPSANSSAIQSPDPSAIQSTNISLPRKLRKSVRGKFN